VVILRIPHGHYETYHYRGTLAAADFVMFPDFTGCRVEIWILARKSPRS
jgi:hypothetical protein